MQRVLYCIFLCLFLFIKSHSLCPNDSRATSSQKETSGIQESQENDFQKGLNSLFENEQFDTTLWNNRKINAGHFDSENWPDTARIVLVDSLQHRLYGHPFKNCITSNFGQRKWLWHYGVDIRLSRGDSVRAAFDGIIRVQQFDRHGYGHVIVIRHTNGLETLYGHLSKELVTQNRKVTAGQVIGLGGNTGHSTGSHLHFETRFYGEPFDPNCIIDFDKYALRSDTLVLTKTDFTYLADQRKAVWHIVRKGETLGHIALWYHTTVKKVRELNHLADNSILGVGRKLLVRANPARDPSLTSLPGKTPNS
jgi:hypothetical protein